MTDKRQIQLEEKQENPLVNLIVNIAIPALILFYGTDEAYLGAKLGFLVALAFPLGYGIYDSLTRKKFNFIAALGIINVLLTGGIGLLQMDNHWLAVKEAAVPAIIGFVVIASLKTPYPLVRKFLYNEKVIDVVKVDEALDRHGGKDKFDVLLVKATYMLAFSFFVSATLNFVLAKVIVTSAPGTRAWDQELARMWSLSWPVIVVPSVAIMMFSLWYLLRGIKALTGLNLDEIFVSQQHLDKK